ncbi:hypothetical protein ECANGB1_1604 [Enterospora canceri]|uniref:Uncharacterized protein n=1 Tax=Enterospora canceri TaxID=1081671 RepID=A0A1Y1S5Q2_9MICR|nr:hypothetical protein ECANGB1_1604 [Enterospora canceri]
MKHSQQFDDSVFDRDDSSNRSRHRETWHRIETEISQRRMREVQVEYYAHGLSGGSITGGITSRIQSYYTRVNEAVSSRLSRCRRVIRELVNGIRSQNRQEAV